MSRAITALLVGLVMALAVTAEEEAVEHITNIVPKRHVVPGIGTRLEGVEAISTKTMFTPPVEITIVAKTDSMNIRLGYAANSVIFNWEGNPGELRIDGGPADRLHKPGAGHVPKNRYVTIKWIVMPTQQQIFVNDELRFEHVGDYSRINNPVTVSSYRSNVSVKSIKVRQLAASAAATPTNAPRVPAVTTAIPLPPRPPAPSVPQPEPKTARETMANAEVAPISAKSDQAYVVGRLPAGSVLMFQYIEGKWKGWGRYATDSPDAARPEGGDRSRLAIAEVAANGQQQVLALVPGDTVSEPYRFVAGRDLEKVVLRMNDTDNDFAGNPDGDVKYRILVQRP